MAHLALGWLGLLVLGRERRRSGAGRLRDGRPPSDNLVPRVSVFPGLPALAGRRLARLGFIVGLFGGGYNSSARTSSAKNTTTPRTAIRMATATTATVMHEASSSPSWPTPYTRGGRQAISPQENGIAFLVLAHHALRPILDTSWCDLCRLLAPRQKAR